MSELQTQYAPAGRADSRTILKAHRKVMDSPLIARLFDAVDTLVFVVNAFRQVVLVNQRVREMLGVADASPLLGLRPGETVGCENAYRCEGGCGTSAYCMSCGGVNSMLSAIEGRTAAGECRIVTVEGDAYEMRVRATPLVIDGETFVILSAMDVSHQKRREALERIFFHDVMNTVSGLRMLGEQLRKRSDSEGDEVCEGICRGMDLLMAEMAGHRALAAAESGDLALQIRKLRSEEVIDEVLRVATGFRAATGCKLHKGPESEDVALSSDRAVVSRILGNLVKNAVEASGRGDTVTVTSVADEGGVRFDVHNPGLMEPDVQRQVFVRSFSTKGDRRGLGTYSVRLLTERYLKGRVGFRSGREVGTIFSVWLPGRIEIG